jgi:hypothetical protein
VQVSDERFAPPRHQLVRYWGYYSNVTRGEPPVVEVRCVWWRRFKSDPDI